LRKATCPRGYEAKEQGDRRGLGGKPGLDLGPAAAFAIQVIRRIRRVEIGTSKTHLAIALGVEAMKQTRRILFTDAADLARQLLEVRDTRELTRLQQRLLRVDVLIIDEIELPAFDRIGRELSSICSWIGTLERGPAFRTSRKRSGLANSRGC
jgi:hypothetical protein